MNTDRRDSKWGHKDVDCRWASDYRGDNWRSWEEEEDGGGGVLESRVYRWFKYSYKSTRFEYRWTESHWEYFTEY